MTQYGGTLAIPATVDGAVQSLTLTQQVRQEDLLQAQKILGEVEKFKLEEVKKQEAIKEQLRKHQTDLNA